MDFIVQNRSETIYGLIVAAGLSDRMGAYKPLLKYESKSFVQNIIEKINSVCDKIIIVTGFRSKDIENEINRNIKQDIIQKIKFVFNEEFSKGMFSSLQKGSEVCSDVDWILYHFIDQPSLPAKFYNNFVQQIKEQYDWIQPVIDGRKGHPILFGNKMKEKIIGANLNSNLRDLSQQEINKKYWQCHFKQIFDDIDNIDDYNNLLNLKQ